MPTADQRWDIFNEKQFITELGTFAISRPKGHRKQCLQGYIRAMKDYPSCSWKPEEELALIQWAQREIERADEIA